MDKLNYSKILRRVLNMMYILIVVAFFLKITGFKNFNISTDNIRFIKLCIYIDSNRILFHIVMGLCNMVIAQLIFINLVADYFKNKKSFIYLNVIAIIIIVIKNLFVEFGYYNVNIVLSILLYSYTLKFGSSKLSVVRLYFMEACFQLISQVIKGVSFQADLYYTLVSLLYVIDYYLMFGAYTLNRKIRGEKKCLLDLSSWEMMKVSLKLKRLGYLNRLTELMKNLENLIKNLSNIWTDRVSTRYFIIHHVAYPIVILGSYAIFAYFSNKEFEAVVVFVCFVAFRYIFPDTFHADDIPNINNKHVAMVCACLTTISLSTALSLVMDDGLSLFSSVIIAFILDLVLFFIKDYIKLYLFYLKNIEFKIKNCSKEDLIARCRSKGYNLEETEIAIKMFIDKLPIKEIAKLLTIEFQSANNKKHKMKKETGK